MSDQTTQEEIYQELARLRTAAADVRKLYSKVIDLRDSSERLGVHPEINDNDWLRITTGAAYSHLDNARKLLRDVYEELDNKVKELRP
ncbi:hypothetical protein HWD07_gp002 [Gordonia phage John316]|uniref:Uncharacterized protein n=3 Tax=Montyvirus TaxID=2733196 RepID=A0A2L1IWE8_9CAUD|nr:hypothetical protein HOS45_gp002 [Gordonia phage BirksAndSocks]YP_009856289.1 hypothetical protein HWD07_gp002 [Gordonia phage John316]AVD99511.1 hypothetical protein SEA_BONEHAM_2 [Gordonia phage Boneham]QRI45479.1 hypothetical protein SEA_EKHEIN_2 [Gordonia phage Ekhein]AUE22118.1 hypothetical protein SEA_BIRKSANDSOCKS_2 [Gordonia phage BirksAndSocks]QIG61879.1 hypothetical protein SEA_JOHN316_2 [Gordonia phage John316]